MKNEDLKNKILDDMLYYAAEHQTHELAKELPLDQDLENPHVFSDEFEKKMNQLFIEQRKQEKRTNHRGDWKRIAGIMLLVVGISSIMISNVEAFRIPVMNFFVEMKEEFTRININKETKDSDTSFEAEIPTGKGIYAPTFIPNGYEVVDVILDKKVCMITYENNKDENLIFSQSTDADHISIDTENASFQEITIDGNQSYLSVKKDAVVLLMIRPDHAFTLVGDIG